MLRLAGQKMWHKKWMNLSLLIGCILLIATLVSFPIYQDAAYDRMLQDEFEQVLTQDGKWPTMIKGYMFSEKDKKGNFLKVQNAIEEMPDKLLVDSEEYVFYYSLPRMEVVSELKRQDAEGLLLRMGCMNNFEDHIKIIAGEGYSESGIDDEGYLELLISKNAMVSTGVLVGERFSTYALKSVDGNPVKVVIKGVYETADENDIYWQEKIDEITDACFIKENAFSEYFSSHYDKYSLQCEYWLMLNYKDIEYLDVAPLIENTKYYTEKSFLHQVLEEPSYLSVLDSYSRKINRISATLMILQIPILVLLCAFLLMISGQMYEMEKNEISVIKSRGASSGQLFRMYLYQGLVLTILGVVGGIPLSMLFSRILGATRNFLEFHVNERLNVGFPISALKYTAIGVILCMCSLTIPAIKHSRTTIVNLKQSKAVRKKPLWQKLFLDFILIGIAGYGYYNFHKNMADIAVSVLQGDSLDPLLYTSSSILVCGLGLLFLRIRPILISCIFKPFESKWGPANFVAFMENIRNSSKVSLIMLFMILTVSLGIYHASVARTILDNAVENTEYMSAADVELKEVWVKKVNQDGTSAGYLEPNFSKYQTMTCADAVTKVLYMDTAYSAKTKTDQVPIVVMGIHTKEFGSMTSLQAGLNEKPFREYLNELAEVKDGVIVSSNFRDELGYDYGDPININANKSISCVGKIVDFVDYWPGFAPTANVVNPDGSAMEVKNYLVVTHFDYLKQQWGTYPYEVWINLKPDCDSSAVSEWIADGNVKIQKYVSREDKIDATISDPLLQGTNGILTLGFVVTLLLCVIGYLIYWIMAIKERELMFGVLRATGFHKGELIWLLINEQIFTGVLAVAAGIGIGNLTAKLFVPILQQAYASENQVLPMKLISRASDMVKIYGVIALSLIVCLGVLTLILFSMNVTKALKLGEE